MKSLRRHLQLLLCLSAFGFLPLAARPATNSIPSANAQPLAVLAFGGGDTTPRTAIYSDGFVLFTRPRNQRDEIFYHKLSPEELASIKDRLKPFLVEKNPTNYFNLAPGIYDQLVSHFFLHDGQTQRAFKIYGSLDGKRSAPNAIVPTRRKPDVLPDEFRDLYEFLSTLDFPNASPWTPATLEVVFCPYSYAPEASIRWPRRWPNLSRAQKWGDDCLLISLPGAEAPALEKFLAKCNPLGAIKANGKKWSVFYHRVIPGREAWKAALRSVQPPKR